MPLLSKSQKTHRRMPVTFSRRSSCWDFFLFPLALGLGLGRTGNGRCPPLSFLSFVTVPSGSLPGCFFTSRPALCPTGRRPPCRPPPSQLPGNHCRRSPPGPDPPAPGKQEGPGSQHCPRSCGHGWRSCRRSCWTTCTPSLWRPCRTSSSASGSSSRPPCR